MTEETQLRRPTSTESNDEPTPQAPTNRPEMPNDLAPQTKLVYLYLQAVPEVTVAELQETLGLDLLSLYPVVRTLERRNLVERRGDVVVRGEL